MYDGAEGFDGIAGNQHVHFHHVGGAVAGVLVVHGAVAFRHGFEAVVEVDENVCKRNGGGKENPKFIDGLRVLQFSALFHDKLHGVANVVAGKHDEDADHRFTDLLDRLRLWEIGGIINNEFFTVSFGHLVNHAGIGGDDVHIKLAAKTFLDDLHVKESEESAAKAKA